MRLEHSFPVCHGACQPLDTDIFANALNGEVRDDAARALLDAPPGDRELSARVRVDFRAPWDAGARPAVLAGGSGAVGRHAWDPMRARPAAIPSEGRTASFTPHSTVRAAS
ncbi:hypothetical protein GCM10010299_54540 [Streptomyces tanashiensis]|nr:hypothetical protein GCM10010299_54540 [Streptomyces tanashiensis]